MRKLLLLNVVALAVFAAGCSKVKHLADINVDIPYTTQVNIPSIPADTAGAAIPGGGLSLSLPSVTFATNSEQYISQYHTAVDKILNVYLKSLALSITTPPNQNFDFLDSVALYISADSQPEVLAAYQYSIPKGQSALNLTTNTNVNLKSYFVQPTMTFRLQTHINAVPASATQLNIASVFHLLANPLE